MAYNNLVPTTGHSGSQDYQSMQGNFAQIQTSFSVNHEPLASGAGTEGFHTEIQFAAPLGADPDEAAPISSLYTKTVSGLTQLFFQNGALAANVAQLTGNAVLTGSEYTIVTPWNFILKFGITAGITTGASVNFQVPFPVNAIGVITMVRLAGSASKTGGQVTGPGSFTALFDVAGPQALYYIAWGT